MNADPILLMHNIQCMVCFEFALFVFRCASISRNYSGKPFSQSAAILPLAAKVTILAHLRGFELVVVAFVCLFRELDALHELS